MKAAGLALVSPDRRVLLVQRPLFDTDPLRWDIPGGHLEPGENPYQAAVREAQEELGALPSITVVGVTSNRGIYALFLASCPTEFVPTLSSEHRAWAWVPLACLGRYAMHPHSRSFLRKLSP